jgi:hypothetical protein
MTRRRRMGVRRSIWSGGCACPASGSTEQAAHGADLDEGAGQPVFVARFGNAGPGREGFVNIGMPQPAPITMRHHQEGLVAEFALPRAATVGDLSGRDRPRCRRRRAPTPCPGCRRGRAGAPGTESACVRPRQALARRGFTHAFDKIDRPGPPAGAAPVAGRAAGFTGRQPPETHEARLAHACSTRPPWGALERPFSRMERPNAPMERAMHAPCPRWFGLHGRKGRKSGGRLPCPLS